MGGPVKDWDCREAGRDHDFEVIESSWAEIKLRCRRCGLEDGAHM